MQNDDFEAIRLIFGTGSIGKVSIATHGLFMTCLDWRFFFGISLAERSEDGDLQRWDFFVGEEIGYPAISEARF